MKLPTVAIHRFNPSDDERIEARRIVADLIACNQRKPCGPPSTNARGQPIPISGFHWSVSHKDGLIAAAIARGPVGVDIELLRPRNSALLSMFRAEEWQLLPERSWLQFYRLWTAKEALSKKLGIGIDAIQMMKLTNATDDTLTVTFRGQSHRVHVCVSEDHVYAVAA